MRTLNYMKLLQKWYQSFLKSIQLQLFISFISLPFLIGWGLPISLLTPISTLLFGPFLTCFLSISSCIFFLEIFHIPNGIFIWLLEHFTHFWLACLAFEQKSWLISFIKPPLIILFLLPLIALCIIHSKKITIIYARIAILSIALISTCILLKLFPYASNTIEKIACHKGELTLINLNSTLLLIDPGVLTMRPSYESYISYTLIPDIIQKKGTLYLDIVITNKFNKRIFDALSFLATKVHIKKVYFPAWNGKIPLFAWRSYIQCKHIIKENGGTLIPLSSKKIVFSDSSSLLSLEPSKEKDISYYDATYKKLCINGIINNQPLIL